MEERDERGSVDGRSETEETTQMLNTLAAMRDSVKGNKENGRDSARNSGTGSSLPGLPGSKETGRDSARNSGTGPGLPGLPSQKPVGQTEAVGSNTQSDQLQRAKKAAMDFCESNGFVAFMTVLTVWALYQGDLRSALTTKEADPAFEGIVAFLFFIFALEILLQSFYKDDYCPLPVWEASPGESWINTWMRRFRFGSFYFWLDVIATFSLVLDISWIIGETAYRTIQGSGVQSAQAGQATVAAARVARVVRVVRMVRLVRMAKLYKYASATVDREKKEEALRKAGRDVELIQQSEESKVGAAMGDLTARRVLVLILAMLIIIPLLNASDPDISLSLGVQLVHALAVQNATDPATYETGLVLAVDSVQRRLPLVLVRFNSLDYLHNDSIIHARRTEELATYTLRDSVTGFVTTMAYDQKRQSVESASYSMYTTTFIVVLLISGIALFSYDVETLVIRPIEKLVELVREISANPLGVNYESLRLGAADGFVEGMETTQLLHTITKIGALLRVGFGEAGANIIARNLSANTGGKLNLMGAGTRIQAIFGFCDVRQFTDATECLQEEVMLFVNRIAHILHRIVTQCSGVANKNIGDAFLLTWKLDEAKMGDAVQLQKSLLADQALLCFAKALVALARHQDFIVNFTPQATARLMKRFPTYQARIGCGLHVGWAIEGAIGSNRKIDASYLSPHVSTSEYLESSTKRFGSSLLLSDAFYHLLSPAAAACCRQVDRVRRSEAEAPMGIYVFDADLDQDWVHSRAMAERLPKNRLQEAAQKMIQQQRAQQQNAHHHHQSTSAPGRRASVNSIPDLSGGMPARPRASIHPNQRMLLQSPSAAFLQHMPFHQSAANIPTEDKSLVELEEARVDAEAAAAEAERRTQPPSVIVAPYTQDIWTEDADIIALRRHVSSAAFQQTWNRGISAYLQGDWHQARDCFHETNHLVFLTGSRDGPSIALAERIDNAGGVAPQDWPGYFDESNDH